MYTVLIAEDELFVRLGIKNSIDWNTYQMHVIYDTENGLDAWDKIKSDQPDVVITDILMPGLNGQELIEKIQQNGLNPYIIVITCMEEFNLAKKLLSLGVRDYLLKATMTENEIGESLQKALSFLEKDRLRYRSKETISDQKIEQNKILLEFFEDPLKNPERLLELTNFGIQINKKSIGVVLATIDYISDNSQAQRSFLKRDLLQDLNDLLQHYRSNLYQIHPILLKNSKTPQFLLLITSSTDSPTLFEKNDFTGFLTTIKEDIEDILNIQLSLSFTTTRQGLRGASDCFDRLKESYTQHYLDSLSSITECGLEDRIQNVYKCYGVLQAYSKWIYQTFGVASETFYKQSIDSLKNSCFTSQEEMIFNLLNLSHHIAKLSNGALENECKLCDRQILDVPFLNECVSALEMLIKNLIQNISKHSLSNYRLEIQKAINYIDQNYYNPNLSLTMVSQQIGLSETYFSTLFKQELHEPFSKYLTKVRVDQAKQLLEQPNIKILDAAMQTGFSDEAYFSRVFKKSTGMSPSEWRALWNEK